MVVKFGAGDDRRGAYIAGSSGAKQSGPLRVDTGEADAFLAGLRSNIERFQGDRPEQFDDVIYEKGGLDDSGNPTKQYLVNKSELQNKLEQVASQDSAFDLINDLGVEGLLDKNTLGYLKNTLANVGAFTTDPNETRNVYQLLINKMFQGDNERMRGALPLNQSDFAGLRRTGPRSFVDPSKSQGFLGDLFSLYTGDNKAAVNLSDLPGGGIAELPEFGKAGLDFTKEQGFRDYGKILEGLITAATPLKYAKMFSDRAIGGLGDIYDSLYPNRGTDEEDNLDTLIDSIDEDDLKIMEGDKKKRFFFF